MRPACALLAGVSWRAVRPSCAHWATLLTLAFLSTGTLQSSMRYGLVIFPIFLVLGRARRRPALDRAYVAMATGLAGLFMTLFPAWYWVT